MLGLDRESLREIDAPSKKDVAYAVFGFILGAILVPVQAMRIFNGFETGRLLITGSWYADWIVSKVFFVVAFVMHVAIAIFALALLWYGVATVRHWMLEK